MANLDFLDYNLDKELIAQHPIYPRDHARLMVVHRDTGEIEHRKFYNIVEYLKKGDCLVLNNSKVLKARFLGTNIRTGGKREIFLLKYLSYKKWLALTSPNDRVHVGDEILVSKDPEVKVRVLLKGEFGENTVEFESALEMEEVLKYGEVPLPPYIKAKVNLEEYQTVYANLLGSVASPTAGLHFTKELLKQIEEMGVCVKYITLHVGLGTFKPIKEDDLNKHKMHEEEFFISKDTAKTVNEVKANGGRIIAVGTTVVRALETASTRNHILKPYSGSTRLFIKPGYPFKMVDALITNFHFPKTTLLALVCAFASTELTLKAYNIAVKERYRFYSFGDAMLIL
ncbi:tRNA preQ1(34) S-adenosylmethionine ribosyltransferase-isomerase QueA [Caldisericum exile]|uniref:S-adenosylmethionine:tRNA ribosyltransferase-isomerase n=1 Tax=Caldisericum exile (strain DSM 21853 / NBRC 104410 / AZM16c01) TaxID=511051 RepID=A0A7U6GEJ1_CALEA|nr:tRNA preQ1(34) S-adenosylmethionine ribosyltransferase-isomerase QueA [Caldisericum exile]BAL80862.1 S-adenosylmethionine--tRNA ribosyltransferase-isomerase [Caldisericum exile AZM16c01]